MAQVLNPKIDAGRRGYGIGFPPTPPQESEPWCHLDKKFYPNTPPLCPSDLGAGTGLGIFLPADSISVEDEPVIAVIGVGYVGTHLVSSFSSQYQVIGFDVSQERISQLQSQHESSRTVQFSSSLNDLSRATHFLISVPTLLRPDKTVDSSYLRDALKTVGLVARRGSTIVIESSVAVGMTRELLGPLATERGFFAGMSPEVSPLLRDCKLSADNLVASRSRTCRASRTYHP